MRSKTNFRVSFFLKKAKLLKNGEASVAMRITVDGQRVENNIRKKYHPKPMGPVERTRQRDERGSR